MKNIILLFSLLIVTSFSAQAQLSKPPVYTGCEEVQIDELNGCFSEKLKADVINEFKVPENVEKEGFKGTINAIFLVTKEGDFEILYVNSVYPELEEEVKRVFQTLPKIQPATFNGRAVDERYQFPIAIPLSDNDKKVVVVEEKKEIEEEIPNLENTLFPEFQSELNIPFVHQEYDDIIYHLNKSENTHTSSKPYLFNEVKPYIDLEAKRTKMLKKRETWGGRKLHNEHLALVKGKDFWFTLNPVFDLQVGKDNSDVDYTYNNTRGLQIQGSIGKKFSFSTSFYESQGRFADYVNDYAKVRTPPESYGVVPGRGRAKKFKEDSFDYPVAEAYLSFTPSKFFNFQFGNGKNFIGDGYRSFFLSDVASPYPFLKISTTFWKIKYTNLWMWMDDVRPSAVTNDSNFRKYVAMHHLSWNVTKRFNIGLFESVITNEESSPNGFDISFFNPIIFYRAVEFNRGSRSGNANIGLNMKYRIKDNISVYTQFLIDEMTTSRVFDGTGYWGNKFAFQLGGKYYNAFKVDGLMLQGEFNWVRPYTFSHGETKLNSGHYNQPLAHLWGGNFYEVIGIARYSKDRWFGNAKLIAGKKGFDFEDERSEFSYGGDIWRSYDDRVSDEGNEVGQGNSTDIFIADFQGGYVLNPVTNLQIFGGVTFRNFTPDVSGDVISKNNTTWFTIGLRSSLFNWYFDF
ncbi:energy transducer TonB [Lutimonas saemankumensis]|uniref:energy transducer TonB n=1 Tax=Lutimonas saemankumensis TaxID=483016 RepID=UPI001CD7DDAC|nr:energy transducer TonB [Lutimonas saemankumensis]MCA0933554.1 energy transducer TonB [Lutimonas saemankumensis]